MDVNQKTPTGQPIEVLVKLPCAEDLSAWIDALGKIKAPDFSGEGDDEEEDGRAAVMARMQVAMLRLWLVSALYIRVRADAGEPLPTNDPGEVEIGATALEMAGHQSASPAVN